MPGIVIANRILPVSSDEIVFPISVLLFIDSFFLIFAIFINQNLFQIFALILFGVGFITDMILIKISITGGLKDLDDRKSIIYPIFVFWTNLLLQLANFVYGCIVLANVELTPTQRVFFYFYMIYLMGVIFFSLLVILGSARYQIDPEEQPVHFRRYIHPLFMGSIYFNRNTDHETKPKDILESVAALLHKLFGDANLVLSDILVGMILVGKEQCGEVFESHVASLEDRSDLFDISKIVRVSRYAEAMYGLPLRVFAKFKSGIYHLCCACVRSEPITAAKAIEKSMDMGFAYLLCCFPGSWYRTKVSHPDLIYKSLDGKLFKSPFAVCVDHDLRAIVIAIRGSMSTTDFLVDLYIIEQEIRWLEDGKEKVGLVHKGIYEITTAIVSELVTEGIFSKIENDDILKTYQVICTGHSLGAGVAALMAFQLKSLPGFEEIGKKTIAYCYSSPGFLISEPAVPYFRAFCTTVILGDDFVCRISPHNTHKLKALISEKINTSSERKVDVIRTHLIEQVFQKRDRIGRQVAQSEQPNAESLAVDYGEYDGAQLYIPGNVLHIKRQYDTMNSEEFQNSRLIKSKLVPFWIDAKIISTQILISRTMILDHLPNRVGNALRSVLQS